MNFDKLLEKLGIYDLFVVLLTGICIVFSFNYLSENLYNFRELFNGAVFPTINFSQPFIVFIVSYFVGMIFQELSNFLELLLYKAMLTAKKDSFFKSFLMLIIPSIDRVLMKSEDISHLKHHESFGLDKRRKRDLSDSEIDDLYGKVKQNGLLTDVSKDDIGDYNDRLYQICKAKASADGKTGRSDKDQSISSMARSLSLYSFVMMIITLVMIFSGSLQNKMTVLAWITAVGCAILFVLFLRRNKRFSESRYVYIFRSYIL